MSVHSRCRHSYPSAMAVFIGAGLMIGGTVNPPVAYAESRQPPLPVLRPKALGQPLIVPTSLAKPERAAPLSSGQHPTVPATSPVVASDCLSELRTQNVAALATQIGPQPDARCTVADAIHLSSLRLRDGSEVSFPDKPTIACATAVTFAAFVRDLLVPLAKGSYGSPVNAVWTGPGLECRTRDHIAGAKLSAHAQGLAVDIASFKLGDGRTIEVGRPKTDLDRSFETAARAGGCGYFHTSLGPGSDAFHETHWHFDILPRGTAGDTKFCQ